MTNYTCVRYLVSKVNKSLLSFRFLKYCIESFFKEKTCKKCVKKFSKTSTINSNVLSHRTNSIIFYRDEQILTISTNCIVGRKEGYATLNLQFCFDILTFFFYSNFQNRASSVKCIFQLVYVDNMKRARLTIR